jgi:hypothetical protein
MNFEWIDYYEDRSKLTAARRFFIFGTPAAKWR